MLASDLDRFADGRAKPWCHAYACEGSRIVADASAFDVITVAIPTFNRRDLLERAARSVLAERRVPIRLQVHDNSSSDGTEEFMRGLQAEDSRVSYVRNPDNVGCLANIALSFGAVRSTLFVPLADDDYVLPDFLFDAYAIMSNDAELGAVAFYAESRKKDGSFINTWPNDTAKMSEGKTRPGPHLRQWMMGSHYSWQAVLWRSCVLEHVGAPYMHTGLSSDVDFQAQVFARYPVFVVKRPGAVFSVHEEQASHGHGVAEVGSWAKLFSRLDKAVERSNVLPPEEYVEARKAMWQRMRPSWLRPSKAPLPLSSLARTAVIAGFRLGDWELAFHLLNEVRNQQAQSRTVPALDASLSSESVSAQSSDQIAGLVDLGLRTLDLLQSSVQREQALKAQVNALAGDVEVLKQAAITVAADRNRIAADLETMRLRQAPTSSEPARSFGLPTSPLN